MTEEYRYQIFKIEELVTIAFLRGSIDKFDKKLENYCKKKKCGFGNFMSDSSEKMDFIDDNIDYLKQLVSHFKQIEILELHSTVDGTLLVKF
jgi:hypothetical protein